MTEQNINVLLIGTGAVGSFYSALLAKSGAKVATVCRSDYDAVKKNGISITSTLGNMKFMPDEVIKNTSAYSKEADFIILATKVLPEIDRISLIRDAVSQNTAIVILQNGINIEGDIAAAFPDNEIISGLAFICVSRTAPGIIDHQDYGRIVIGTYPGGNSEKVKLLSDMFNSSGINCTIDEDIVMARWRKLIWNAPFNPISVIGGGINTAQMLSSRPTIEIIEKIMEEVVLLSEKDGHPLPHSVIEKNISDTKVMKPYKTSMLLDYENKRPMEVEAILGNVVRLAEKYNAAIPHIKTIYGVLTAANNNILKGR